jgi:hypothetical protein
MFSKVWNRVCVAGCVAIAVIVILAGIPSSAEAAQAGIPRMDNGRPNLQGIWQVRNRAADGLEAHPAAYGILPGDSVLADGGTIPYQPAALGQRNENFRNRVDADPLNECYLPGVPRIMYMEHPFQIFQSPDHIAMTFEWSLAYRLIYTNGEEQPYPGIPFWMGDSRGRWEGDTLVVDVRDHNDKTWFDKSGNFHSDQMTLEERYTMVDADTITYEVTVTDPAVFTEPWTIRMPLYRHKDMTRVLEYHCQAEREEFNGDFERHPETWYPRPGQTGPEIPEFDD